MADNKNAFRDQPKLDTIDESGESGDLPALSVIESSVLILVAQGRALGYQINVLDDKLISTPLLNEVSFSEPRIELISYVNEPVLADILIEVNNLLYHGHSMILAATSGFFHRMLTTQMAESSLKKIIDIELPVRIDFEILLRYLYTNITTEILSMNIEAIVCMAIVADYLEAEPLFHLLCNRMAQQRPPVAIEEKISLHVLENVVASDAPLKNKLAWISAMIDQACFFDDDCLHDLVKKYCVKDLLALSYSEIEEQLLPESLSRLLRFIPLNAVVTPLKKRIKELEDEVADKTRDKVCRLCGEMVSSWDIEHGNCFVRIHSGNYRAGNDHGWSCCDAKYKKSEGCTKEEGKHRRW